MDLAGHSLQLVLLNHTGLFALEMLLFYFQSNNSLIALVISTTLAVMAAYRGQLSSISLVLVVFKVKKYFNTNIIKSKSFLIILFNS